MSFYARWVLPESGFEAYGEWARDDHAWDLRDFITEPDHTQAYTVGFQKLVSTASRWVRLAGEATHTQEKQANRSGRPTGVFYSHDPHGYTQAGQLLGVGIGPGANSQYLGGDLIMASGLVGFHVERVARDEGSPTAIIARNIWPYRHDVELSAGMRSVVFTKRAELRADMTISRRLSRNFVEDETNINLVAGVVIHSGGTRVSIRQKAAASGRGAR